MSDLGGTMNENLRETLAKALAEAEPDNCFDDEFDSDDSARHEDRDYYRERADAVLAVVGPELDRLRAKVEAHRERANSNFDVAMEQRARADAALAEVEALPYCSRVYYNREVARADRAEAERDVLRARLAKVEALGDGRWDHSWGCSAHSGGECDCWLSALRAVLASVPEPSDSEPAPDADRCTGASDCGAPLHVHGCYADMTGPCDDPADHAPDADREAGERA